MTTREIYFKNVALCDLPMTRVGYVCKNHDGVIQIGWDICLELEASGEVAETSIEIMEGIEKAEGFMFWNSSPEGEIFFKENWKTINDAWANIILNQK